MIFAKMNSCRKHPKRYRKKGLRNDGRPQRKLGNIGNRSKLSQIDSEKLISDIAGGVAVTIACAAQGIHRDTFYSWLEKQPEFAMKLAAAKRDVIVKAIATIRTGSKDSEWRGDASFLRDLSSETTTLRRIRQVSPSTKTISCSASSMRRAGSWMQQRLYRTDPRKGS